MYTYNNESSVKVQTANELNQFKINEIELLRAKILAFREATEVGNDGSRAMSEGMAKRLIFKLGDAEIAQDLVDQFTERKIRAELFDEAIACNETDQKVSEQPKKVMAEIESIRLRLNILEQDNMFFYKEVTKLLDAQNRKINSIEVSMALFKEHFFNLKK